MNFRLRLFPAFPVLLFFLAVGAAGAPALGCTTLVASGKATADGRPMLWKNRDAKDHENQVVYLEDGRIPYLGLVNGKDLAGLSIWAGVNARGFAIMNNASYNLDQGADTTAEGWLMKLALQSCATVEEFEALLERTNPAGRDVAANFGVIDAVGGAAYFETSTRAFKRFDANDPAAAPQGYIVRSNYSHSGDPDKGTGFTRESRAIDLILGLVKERRLDGRALLAEVARDAANIPLGSFPLGPWKPEGPAFAYTADSISRQDTASVFLVAGVKPGEDPLLSTAWVVLGLPQALPAVPVWVRAAGIPPEIAAGTGLNSFNQISNTVRGHLYPKTSGELFRYMKLGPLTDPGGSYQVALAREEGKNWGRALAALQEWTAKPPEAAAVRGLQNDLCRQTLEALKGALQPFQ